MKRVAFKTALLGSFMVLSAQGFLISQTTVGKITKPDLVPTAIAVYEKGNKVCIADRTSGSLLIYDSTTLQELGAVSVGLASVTWMEVNETFGKLYAAAFSTVPSKIAVVDLDGMKLLPPLEISLTFPRLGHDEGLDKLYVLHGEFYAVDVATDSVTIAASDVSSGYYADIAVNPVTHEVFVCHLQFDALDIFNGETLARTTIPGIAALGGEVNYLENKLVLGYAKAGGFDFDMCVFDRNTNTIIPLPGIQNDASEFAFNPRGNRMYSNSEVNAIASIIEGSSNAFFNLPLLTPTGTPKVRLSTGHVYYPGRNYIGVLDDATQLFEIIPIADPAPNSILYDEASINQTTGRVFVTGAGLNYVTVLQDEEVMTRPPIYICADFNTMLRLFDPGSGIETTAGIQAPSYGFPFTSPDSGLAIAVKPGGGRFFVPSGSYSEETGLTVYAGCGSNARIAYILTGGSGSIAVAGMPDGTALFKTNSNSNTVSVVDPISAVVLATIPTGTNPWGIAISPSGSHVFVANKGSNTVSIIDPAARKVSLTVPVGSKPWGIAVSPSGSKAYVSNYNSGTVSVIDVASGSSIKTVTVGSSPRWLAFSSDGRFVFVANSGSGTVSVIDAGSDVVVQTVNVGGRPEAICAFPQSREMYVGVGSNLAIISTEDFSVTTVPLQTLSGSADDRILSLGVADVTSRFAGRVTAMGLPLGGILARVLQGGVERGRSISNASGDYCVYNLRPGTYTVEFSAPGYRTQTSAPQAVQIGRVAIVNMIWDTVVDSITVVSPVGGEIWEPGSDHWIMWASAGNVGDVRIEYSTNHGLAWSTAVASTPNDGSYAWSAPLLASGQCLVRVSEAADGSPLDESDAVFSLVATKPVFALSRRTMNYGAEAGSMTRSQSVRISNAGVGTLAWTATPSAAWITATPSGGAAGGTVAIGVNATGLGAGTYSGSVAFTDPAASNSPQALTVTLRVYGAGGTASPFGSFDTPTNGTAGVTGAIPVTGWALDDIEVTKIEIKRDRFTGDPEDAIGPDGLVYIGDGIFVEGARPDVETAYPSYPFSYRGGWGYMLLTNFLPSFGNGTFKLYAIATDKEGNVATLGSKMITCSNATAVKPFGTIDTPAQGGDASGNPFLNFGWVLTPLPKTVPINGSTIQVYVDSVLLGTLATAPNVYNQYRVDVSTNFPGLNNTGSPGVGGPVGAYFLDTTKYANGVHTIHWVAYDDAGAGDGIGSRYFNVVNTGSSPGANVDDLASAAFTGDPLSRMDELALVPRSYLPIRAGTGLRLKDEPRELLPEADGVYRVEIPEVDRVVIELGEGANYSGYLIVGDALRPLPIGSMLDSLTGRFSWMPGPGFLGSYDLVFVESGGANPPRSFRVRIVVTPKC
jgi:YVTN family beta-propeller protein